MYGQHLMGKEKENMINSSDKLKDISQSSLIYIESLKRSGIKPGRNAKECYDSQKRDNARDWAQSWR